MDTNPIMKDLGSRMLSDFFDGEDERPTMVGNTFEALEVEALRYLSKYRLLAIEPLIPSAFLDDTINTPKS
ncbi:UDP-glycosyltransferase 75C1-like [Salvia divinorum]|uniref:UDP-glycosyltransferase 75C1-like n=1 Tax=Salvia divinorum TaxID=28513 RepID=A0ABD1IE58_SALDI